MSIEPPFPDLNEYTIAIGEAGLRLSEIESTEGAAGNISVYLGWPVEVRRKFPEVETIQLPLEVPELAGGTLLVSGSGRRLREIILDPAANLGALVVEPGGKTGRLYTAPGRLFANLTSELNSHLAVHRDQIALTGTNFHAVVHAQPPHLTYLSHIPRYQKEAYLNRRLLRWQPELIVQIPDGIGLVEFNIPGSAALMAGTLEFTAQPPHCDLGQTWGDVSFRSFGQARRRPHRIRRDRCQVRMHGSILRQPGRRTERRRDPRHLQSMECRSKNFLEQNFLFHFCWPPRLVARKWYWNI